MKILYTVPLAMLLAVGSMAITQSEWTPQAHAAEGEHGHGGEDDGHAHKGENVHGGEDDGHAHKGENVHGGEDDDHAHKGANVHGGEDDGHGHGDGREGGGVIINLESANRAGIVTEPVGAKTIHIGTTLTGRITLNRNKTYAVRARFPGIVKDVRVSWGQKVKEGQELASIESNDSLRNYSVFAPRSGVVLELNTNIGDVAGDAPLFVIADLSEVWGEFHVFPRYLDQVREGQTMRVHKIDQPIGTHDHDVASKVSMLLPTADPLSQTVLAIVPIPNKQGSWRPGMIVEGHVELASKDAPLAVTQAAIQQMEDNTVVFVKEGENSYVPRAIMLGEGDGQYIEVLEGLSAGEQYVSQGSFTIKADILKGSAEHSH